MMAKLTRIDNGQVLQAYIIMNEEEYKYKHRVYVYIPCMLLAYVKNANFHLHKKSNLLVARLNILVAHIFVKVNRIQKLFFKMKNRDLYVIYACKHVIIISFVYVPK